MIPYAELTTLSYVPTKGVSADIEKQELCKKHIVKRKRTAAVILKRNDAPWARCLKTKP